MLSKIKSGKERCSWLNFKPVYGNALKENYFFNAYSWNILCIASQVFRQKKEMTRLSFILLSSIWNLK